MKTTSKLLTGVAAFAFSAAAFAFPVDLTSVDGQFVNPVGGTNVNGAGTNQINWGTPAGSGQSGYRFDGASPLPYEITDETPFVLGSLTHINKPITGDAISGVDLSVSLGFGDLGGTGAATGGFVFSHTETPNDAPVVTGERCTGIPFLGSCLFGSWKDIVENIGDVDDMVVLDYAYATSSEFTLGSNIYTLDLVGFAGGIEEFFTAENAETSIDLLARLNVTAIPVPVPEPGTLALLGLGLAGLGAARRRSRK